MTIDNIKDPQGRISSKVYNLYPFDDQLLLYRQYCVYISNRSSTLTMLDFSNNQEIEEITQRRDYFTNLAGEKLYIDMRDSLGYTGKLDPMKRNDLSIQV